MKRKGQPARKELPKKGGKDTKDALKGKEKGKGAKKFEEKMAKRKGDSRNKQRWKHHYEEFDDMLKKMGLRLEDIDGDGNCLFRSISDQLSGHQGYHLTLRAACCDYMVEDKERLQHFLDVDDDLDFDDYVEWARKEGNWCGYFEIYCLGNLLGCNFRVMLKDGNSLHLDYFDPKAVRTLVLAFHSEPENGIPEHYSSVRSITDDRKSGLSTQISLALLDATRTQALELQKQDSSSSSQAKDKKESSDDEEEPSNTKKGAKGGKSGAKSEKKQKKEARKEKKQSKGSKDSKSSEIEQNKADCQMGVVSESSDDEDDGFAGMLAQKIAQLNIV